MASKAPDEAAQVGLLRRRILTEGSGYTLASVAPMVAGVAITPFVTRVLGEREYGEVALAISTYQILAVVLAMGLPAAVTRDAILRRSGEGGAAGLAFVGSLGAFGIAAVVGATAGLWSPHLLALDGRPAAGAVVIAAAMATVAAVQALLRARGDVRRFVLIGAASALLPPLTGLSTSLVLGASSASYVWGAAVTYVAVATCAVLAVLPAARPVVRADLTRAGLRLGVPTVPHQLALVGAGSLIAVVAGHWGGTGAAARMQLAVMIGSVPILLMGAVNNSWAPMVYRASEAERPRVIAQTATTLAAAAGVLSLLVALLAPVAVAVLAPPEMRGTEMYRACALIAAAACLAIGYLGRVHLIFVRGATARLAGATVVSLLIAYAAVAVLRTALPGFEVWLVATALPIFYLTQNVLVALLVRAVEGSWLTMRRSDLLGVSGAIACCVVGAADPNMFVRGAGALAVTVAGGVAVWRLLHASRVGDSS